VKYNAVHKDRIKNYKQIFYSDAFYPLNSVSREFVEYSNGKFACTPKSIESEIDGEISTVAYEQDDDFEKKITILMDTNIGYKSMTFNI
ncbi:hypothetical protein COBT_002151, partial [Conglomerata obtusa]